MEKLTGSMEHVIFHNDKNGYTVCDCDIDGELVTMTGVFESPQEGDYLSFWGNWTEHPSFGQQFSVQRYGVAVPQTKEGLLRYLSSGLLPGVGEKTARAMVDHFGEGVLDILDHHPKRLAEVPGIGPKTVERIVEGYHDAREAREVVITLQDYGISAAHALKLYKTYGADTLARLLADPYQIIGDVRGIGFRIADAIADALGFAADHPKRIAAGITQSLRECYASGNTYMTREELETTSARLLGVDREAVSDQVQAMTLLGTLKLETLAEGEAYYPMALYMAEDNAALAVARLAREGAIPQKMDVESAITQYEKDMGIALAPCQREAIQIATTHGMAIITGGPGTGKTTIMGGILTILKAQGLNVALTAPTGRAAKRMAETTGEEATTLHRLLEYDYTGDDTHLSFGRDGDNPLEVDAVIVDEASMIDILLFDSLLTALRPGTRLIMVGDADQLPSVGPGNVLGDLIESGTVPVVCLTYIYRQSETSMISVNAHAINQGEVPDIDNQSDFLFIRQMAPETVRHTILDLMERRLAEGKGYNPMTDAQVITPVKKGVLGTIALNAAIQGVLNPANPHKAERSMGSVTFREGDKVMQIRNNYKMHWMDDCGEGDGVYNGDIGIITAINTGAKTLELRFTDGKEATYGFDQLEELNHAYAMTVHKSQGSEFPVIIMPMVGGSPMFLTRKLLYTAVTRAKALVILIGPQHQFYRMIHAGESGRRRTGLVERMAAYGELGV